MKKKIIIFLIIANFLLLGGYKTYASYKSGATAKTSNFEFAKIIFNNEETSTASISLEGLYPGDSKDYNFVIANNKDGIRSEVNVEYELTVETYHTIPTIITITNSNNEQVLLCDETTGTRNAEQKLVCKSDKILLPYNQNVSHNYTVNVLFDSSVTSLDYSNLMDYIDIKVESNQKI